MELLKAENIVLFAIIAIAVWVMWPFITPLLLAGVTAYILYPIVNGLKKYLKSYHLSLMIVLLVIVTPIVLAFVYSINDVVPVIVESAAGVSSQVKSTVVYLGDKLSIIGGDVVSERIQLLLNDFVNSLKGVATKTVLSIPKLTISVLIYLFSTYYFLKDGIHIKMAILRYGRRLSKDERSLFASIIEGVGNSFDLLFTVYITVSLATMIFAFVGFYLLGIPYPAFLAILAGIFSFIPIIGPWMVYGGVAFYELTINNINIAILLLVYGILFISLIPDFVIRPIIGAKKGKVHPLTILLGFFGGAIIFGVKGFLLGPIILTVAETVLNEYLKSGVRK